MVFKIQRSNLRSVTQRENVQNRKMNANNRSGYRGVWFNPKTGHYQAYGKIAGRKVTVGYYPTAELANLAVTAWRERHYAGLVD